MNITKANKAEHDRLKHLIEKETDKFKCDCLTDDLKKLEKSPQNYWMHFDLNLFQPGNILETQRFNTIQLMQTYYSK